MEQSEQARRMAEQQRDDAEQQLVDAHAPHSDDERGFDRIKQGAPRSDDKSRYSGQSAYGSLERGTSANELQSSSHARERDGQKGDFGEGNYGGERGQAERGGLSSYGNSSGSRYVIDNEAGTIARTKSPELSHPGAAEGGAPVSTNVGQYAGEYDDKVAKPSEATRTEERTPTERQGAANANTRPFDESGHIHEEIAKRLLERDDLELRDISVAVAKSQVTLNGSVPERRLKQIIEAIVDNVDGVIGIDNQIEVRRIDDSATTFNNPEGESETVSPSVSATPPTHTGAATFGAASADAQRKKQGQDGQK